MRAVPREAIAGWGSEVEGLVRGHVRTVVARGGDARGGFCRPIIGGGQTRTVRGRIAPSDGNDAEEMKSQTAQCS